ncbi:MAG: NAD(P)/FAD-dependent oxidoreductase [Gammaproteobacteria bacterium]|nr:NAD(P)/FAD-dependent oxidoreductase [Gammaproteobacteria bacterium]
MTKDSISTDALIIGAGPVGLFQVFELGLLGIKAHILDSLREPGGQCTELYPDKPIYDIPGIPVCSGQELVDALLKQIEPFNATFHLGDEVTELRQREDGSFDVHSSRRKHFVAKTIFIAGGVGSFQPRKIRLAGLEAFEDEFVFYRVRDPDRFAGLDVVILGGGDSALDWVLALIDKVKSLVLVHRRPEFRAAPATVAQMQALCEADKMRFIEGKIKAFDADDETLRAVTIASNTGEDIDLKLDALLAFFGLAPKLGPIADWGLDINRKTINVDTEKFETNIPGIFAVGDINQYPGKKKLILSGFHEAALAAFAAKAILEPGKRVHLQYTTTSPIMHQRLGVDDA